MPYGTTIASQRTFLGADGLHARAICGHSSWTAADAQLTRPADATATVVGGAIGSSVSALFAFSNFFEGTGAHGLLTGMKLVISASGIAVPSSIAIRAHLFNADVSASVLSANADKGTLKLLLSSAGSKLGVVDFASFIAGGSGSDCIESYGTPSPAPMHIKAADNARDLFAILVATSIYTPVSTSIHALFASRSSL